MRLCEQAELFAALNGLGATAGAKLFEGAAAVRLDGVLADKEGFADLAVAEAAGYELEDLEFAARDAEALAGGIGGGGEAGRGRRDGGGPVHRDDAVDNRVDGAFDGALDGAFDGAFDGAVDDALYDALYDALLGGEEPGSEPDADASKEDGNEEGADSDGVLEDDEVELGPLEQRDKDATYQTEDQHLFAHPALFRRSCRSWYRGVVNSSLRSGGEATDDGAWRPLFRLFRARRWWAVVAV